MIEIFLPAFIVFILLVLAFRTGSTKGQLGEKRAAASMRILDETIYIKFHNVIIPSKNGSTQIDHLLVSPYGIFLIETKNIKGWIFGGEDQPRWSQSLYGRNFSFQNPLRQAFRQKKVLIEYLTIDESVVHTIIYFAGNCEFKTDLPNNVINWGLVPYIRQYQQQVLSPAEVELIIQKLEQIPLNNPLTIKDHLKSLHDRHSSTTVCPKCGSNLVIRTSKTGFTAGSKFLGCVSYPQCKFIRNI